MFRKTSAIAPNHATNGRELVMGPQAPVRVQETRRSGRSLEVSVPVSQSRHVALAWSLVIGSSLFIVLAVGPVVYWLAAGIVAAAAFVWVLALAQKWEDGVTPSDLFAAFLLSSLAGLVAWSLWKVAGYVGFVFELSVFWTKAMALCSVLSFTFAVVYASVLSLAFVQELAQRSPFQEQHGWRVIFDLLEWAVKKRGNSRNGDYVRHVYHGSPPAPAASKRGDNGQTASVGGAEVAAQLWEAEVIEAVQPDVRADILEFLVRGQRIVDDHGHPIRYNRRKWGGIRLSSGTLVSQNQAKVWAHELAQAGILAETGTGLDLAPDLSLSDALDHITIEYRIPPPHPATLRKWATQVRIPTQPSPTQATQATQQGDEN